MNAPPDERALVRAACSGDAAHAQGLLDAQPGLAASGLFAAAVCGDVAALERHLAQLPLSAGAPSPLVLAALSVFARPGQVRALGVRACCERLLIAGCDPRAGLPDGELPGGLRTALGCAAGSSGNPELVALLLASGVPPQDGDALFEAATHGQWQCAQLLIDAGADWNATSADGASTPLQRLLDTCYSREGVEHLLAAGADPELRVGPLAESALHVAVRRRRAAILPALHGAGADLEGLTRGGMSARRHALRRGFDDVLAILDMLGAQTDVRPEDELALALQAGDLASARSRLTKIKRHPRDWPPEEARLLPDLAGQPRPAECEFLLEAGVSPDARGLDDGTALHQAAWFGQPACARVLIARGLALDTVESVHHGTPLGWVAHGSRFSDSGESHAADYAAVARALLEAGAPRGAAATPQDRESFALASPAVAAVLDEFDAR